MEKSVYLLEDDDGICDLVRCTLLLSDIECSTFGTVRAFEDAVAETVPAIAVLDIMLPDGNGLDVLTRVKSRHPEVYCIMLSALGKESDKVTGLNLGADDYIAKPFGILEFSAKIAAVFRRIKKKPAVLTVGDVTMDCEKMTVTLAGRDVSLSGKEFKLLQYSLENPDKVLTRDELLSNVWGYEGGETRTIDNYVSHLRKLGFNYETVFGVGYKYRAK